MKISVIPQPLSVQEKTGSFFLTDHCELGGDFFDIQQAFSALLLQNNGLSLCGNDRTILFAADCALNADEYRLTVSPKQVRLEAGAAQGAFYGVQTLRQLCHTDTAGKTDSLSVPCCEIHDRPRFSHRGFMFDVARHFFDKEYLKKTLDMMALLKMNIFHWHLTDDQGWRVEIKKYPLLTQKGCVRSSTALNSVGWSKFEELRDGTPYGEGKFFSQEDVREIVAYAKERFIDIVPEIDMPGHLVAAIACYPELSCTGEQTEVSNRWGVMDTIGCCGKDAIYRFVEDVIDELTELFPYEYFHIGGDEVPKGKWEHCPNCQAKIKALGLKNENDLQGHFNNIILAYLKKKNRKMIGWNEILEASALSDETVVQWWTGDHNENGVLQWLEQGNRIVLSPNPYLYMDHFYSLKDLRKSYSVDLNELGLDDRFESQVLGIEAPVWTEYIRDTRKLEFNIYPRLQSLAEICWTSRDRKDFADFEERLAEFVKILDSKGIVHAPREAYLCEGEGSKERAENGWRLFESDPYSEMNTYLK